MSQTDLHSASDYELLADSVYIGLGYHSLPEDIWLRPDLMERLKQANQYLNLRGAQLLLLDGWRSDSLQSELWEKYRKEIAISSGLSGEELEQKTREFVNPPGVTDGVPAPHSTGGTIDLTLANQNGKPIDMGGDFDELTDRSHPDYYEEKENSLTAQIYRDRRRLLKKALLDVGFIQLETEWWHFEYGTHYWAEITGNKPLYGHCDLDHSLLV